MRSTRTAAAQPPVSLGVRFMERTLACAAAFVLATLNAAIMLIREFLGAHPPQDAETLINAIGFVFIYFAPPALMMYLSFKHTTRPRAVLTMGWVLLAPVLYGTIQSALPPYRGDGAGWAGALTMIGFWLSALVTVAVFYILQSRQSKTDEQSGT